MDKREEFQDYFDSGYEKALPQDLLKEYDITECMGTTSWSDTLLVVNKSTGKKSVAKCYRYRGMHVAGMEPVEITDTKNAAIPSFVTEYENEEYRVVLREYIEGISLDAYVKLHMMTEEETADMALKLAQLMRELHEGKPAVIHRDIKPQNIIVKEDGELALIDFGISRVYKEEKTSDTVFCGTSIYAPPEQYGFMQTDVRSDIYSFGVVLSWLLTGEEKPVKNPATGLEKVAARCCEFTPENRYHTDASLIKALKRKHPEYRRRSGRRGIIMGVAASLLILIGVAGCKLYYDELRTRSVSFKEPLIEDAVRKNLDKPSGILTRDDLEKVTSIYIVYDKAFASQYEGWSYYEEVGAHRGELRDLSDLRQMPNLQMVYIFDQHISDISPLADLEELRYIDLRNNDVQDTSPLIGKEKLEGTWFDGNKINSIDYISSCPSLSYLSLRDAGSFDCSPIADMIIMDFLDIACDSDACFYLDGRDITELKLDSPGQKDLECIRGIGSIERLYIYYSEITDISALEGREDITYFNAVGCPIKDLSPLFTMSNLRTAELDLSVRGQMQELAEVYGEPDFEIIYTE